MKKILITTILCISSFLKATDSEEVRLLREQNKEIQRLIAEQQNRTAKQEEIINLLTSFIVQEHQQQQRRILNIQEAQREWEQSAWYEKAWSYTKQGTETFLFRYLIPNMVSQIASQVAGEGNKFLYRSIDKLTGDLCEQYLGKEYGFRPGERLMLSPEGRKVAEFKRYAQQDPELLKLTAEVAPYEQQICLSHMIDQERNRLLTLKAQKEYEPVLTELRQLDSQAFLNLFKQQARQEIKEKKETHAVTQEQLYAVRIIEQNWHKWREKNNQPL